MTFRFIKKKDLFSSASFKYVTILIGTDGCYVMSSVLSGVVQQLDLRKREMTGLRRISAALLSPPSVHFPRMVSFTQSDGPVLAVLTQG